MIRSMLLLKYTHLLKSFSSYSFALYEIANVTFNNSFHLLTALSYTELLTVFEYLSGASVSVSPEQHVIQKFISTFIGFVFMSE